MRYRELGRGTGLRVSEIALGTALFGTAWGYGADPAESRLILEAYAEAGGNFIDTADSYQAGESEIILGALLKPCRDRFVVGSKFTLGAEAVPKVLTTGNSRKNMVRSVEESLKRLKTDRLDLLWVHMWDGVTGTEEVMRGLEDMIRSGKVLYAGLSDFPAWRVARAATLAELRGWSRLVAVQTEYSLVERTSERELLPMAAALGLGLTAWSPLGGGLLTGKYRRGEPGRATTFGAVVHSESDQLKTGAVDVALEVAAETGVSAGEVALAWSLTRGVIPVIGPRTRDQLAENLAAARLRLTSEQLGRLEEASRPSLGFPHDFLNAPAQADRLAGGAAEQYIAAAVPPA